MKISKGISVSLAATCALLAICAFASIADAQTDTSADTSCKPITTTACGCGKVLDSNGNCKSGTNKYQCPCQQTDAGKVTSGMCDATGVCKANDTNGKAPQLPTPQQTQQPSSATPAPQQEQPAAVDQQTPASSPAVVSPDQATGLTPQSSPTLGQSSTLTGSSLIESAYQQYQDLVNGQTPPAPTSDTSNNEPSWLSGAQVGLQPTGAPDTFGNVPSGEPVQSVPGSGETPTLEQSPLQQTLGNPMGGLSGLTSSDIQGENALANQPGAEVAQQEYNAIQNTPGMVAPSSLEPVSDAGLPDGSPDAQDHLFTAYGVCEGMSQGCDSMEGPPTTAITHLDSNGMPTNQIYTLDGYANGQVPYVTVVGPPNQFGQTGVIPQITYNDPASGQPVTLNNVPYMVADTGSDFPNGSNKMDIPLTIPTSDYPSNTGSIGSVNSILNTQPFSSQEVPVIPTSNLADSLAVASPWNQASVTNVADFSIQDTGVFPAPDNSWAQAVLSQDQLAAIASEPVPQPEAASLQNPVPETAVVSESTPLAPQSSVPEQIDWNAVSAGYENALAESANQNSALEEQALGNTLAQGYEQDVAISAGQNAALQESTDENALAQYYENAVAESSGQNATLEQQAFENTLATGYEGALAESANQNAALADQPDDIARIDYLNNNVGPGMGDLYVQTLQNENLALNESGAPNPEPPSLLQQLFGPSPEAAAPAPEAAGQPLDQQAPAIAAGVPDEAPSTGEIIANETAPSGEQAPSEPSSGETPVAVQPTPAQVVSNGFDAFTEEGGQLAPQQPEIAATQPQSFYEWQAGIANNIQQALTNGMNTLETTVEGWAGMPQPELVAQVNPIDQASGETIYTQPTPDVTDLSIPQTQAPAGTDATPDSGSGAQPSPDAEIPQNAAPAPSHEPPTVPDLSTSPNAQGQSNQPVYAGNSLVDYLDSVGQDLDKAGRAALAAEYGFVNYTGTALENTQLLQVLRNL